MKLLQTKDYLLWVDEEAEIKEGDYYWWSVTNSILKFRLFKNDNHIKTPAPTSYKIIGYYPLTKEAKELDLPLLPPFEDGIEKLAQEHCPEWNYSTKSHLAFLKYERKGFIKGYKAAQSKQFTLEDMLDAFEYGLSKPEFQLTRRLKEDFEKFIKSLSTQQLPKEFIPEYEIGAYPSTGKQAKRLKTITNSEGKEVLVGTYKY